MIKPILFNTDMVRAFLGGRKTVTRRVAKWCVQDVYGSACFHGKWHETYDPANPPDALVEWYLKNIKRSPYQPGDILYVRETWGWSYCHDCSMADGGIATVDLNNGHIESDPFRCDDETAERVYFEKEKEYGCYCYKASAEDGEIPDGDGHWHPSIHMPKEAARLFLKVTDVRAERLQDITDGDCEKEGIQAWTKDKKLYKYAPADNEGDYPMWAWSDTPKTPQDAMQRIWDKTIKPKDLDRYGWNANPWVWVVEFEKIKSEDIRNG